MSNFIDSLTVETLTAEEYLSLPDEKRALIEDVEIVPPVLGQDDFGKFKVKSILPIYRDLYGKPITK